MLIHSERLCWFLVISSGVGDDGDVPGHVVAQLGSELDPKCET